MILETTLGLWPALGLMLLSFAILAKCADWFVEGAIGVAERLRMPPIVIGIVVVSLGTTAPELAVSISAALKGQAEMALGNAVGSVIYDDGLALALAALLAPAAIAIDRAVLRSSAIFLIAVDLLGYAMCRDGVLDRLEGGILVLGFVGYLLYSYLQQRRRPDDAASETPDAEPDGAVSRSWRQIVLYFGGGLTGVVISSDWIVLSATDVATHLGVPPVLIALAAVALGTSIPEVATCVIAARKGQGGLAVGNILGADILNICWIAGASALVNPLHVSPQVIHFMFPAMITIVVAMLGLMRWGYRLDRWNGAVLLGLLTIYLVLLVHLHPPAL
jgi:cation:H+ antiporter